jgi:hypothetical protein
MIGCLLVISSFGTVNITTASAGQDDFIMPYYNGYVEDGATILSQDTLIDMSGYNGVNGVGFDAGVITAASEYQLNVMQENTVFYLPYAGLLEDLNSVTIKVNGSSVVPERLYGDMPYYHAGLGGDGDTILGAIASVKPSTLEGVGKLYTFETSEELLEYSFLKTSTQTVLHNGLNWSSYGADGYSIKYNTNTNDEYPYKLFVTEGELQNFTANVGYEITDVTYKDFLDFYVDELVAEIGEEYRAMLYSNFNRQLDGQVKEMYDVIYHYSDYVFALLKTPLPVGAVSLTVDSKVSPMVNGLYKPYIYTIRTVSAYQQACAYSLSVIPSDKLSYLVEQNIGLDDFLYAADKQVADGYYIMCADKKPDYALDNNTPPKDKKWILYLGIGLGGAILLGAGIYLFVSWRKSR